MPHNHLAAQFTSDPAAAEKLRQQAEQAFAAADQAQASLQDETSLPADVQRLLHELRVHQIELEMQNDELRRTQLELETTSARYFDLYDMAPVGYITIDQAGPIRMANFTAASMVGTPRARMIGMLVSRFIHHDDQDHYYLLHKRLADSGQVQSCELQMLKSDTKAFWVHITASPQVEPDGAAVTRLVLTDISDRKKSELQVRHSEYRYRAIFATSHDAVFFTEPDGRIFNANAAAQQMFGYTEDEFKKYGRQMLIDPADPALAAALAERDRTGKFSGELTFTRKDGTRFPAEVSSSQIPDIDGKPCASVIIRDISRRRLMEQAQAASMLEKEGLLKEIHHRVKNNLQIISSLLRLESSRKTSPEAKDVLDDMKGRIGAMALLHETLYRSRAFADLDLAAYIKDLANQAFRAQAPTGCDIRLKLELAPARIGLEQATPCGLLTNELLSNSLKHAFPAGRGGEIRIAMTSHGEPTTLRLTVSDTGVGLPADWEIRSKSSLGLQLVSDLALQLGGVLTVGPGPGSEFTVEFTPYQVKLPERSA